MINLISEYNRFLLSLLFFNNPANRRFPNIFLSILKIVGTHFIITFLLKKLGWLNVDSVLIQIASVILITVTHIIVWAKNELLIFIRDSYYFFIRANLFTKILRISLFLQIYIGFFCLYSEYSVATSFYYTHYLILIRWILGLMTFHFATSFLEMSTLYEKYKIIILILLHWFVIDYWGRDMIVFVIRLMKTC